MKSIVLAVVVSLLPLIATPIYAADDSSAVDIRRNLDATIAHARKYINEPGVLVDIFDGLGPAGDDPRVISFCGEVVEKSTNSASIVHAVQMLSSIARLYRDDDKRRETIAAYILRAAGKDGEPVQLQSYDALLSMGSHYSQEAHAGYRRILGAKYRAKDEENHKRICVFAIQSILRSPPVDTADSIAVRSASEKLGLFEFYQRRMFNRDSKSAAKASQAFLDRWRAALSSGPGAKR